MSEVWKSPRKIEEEIKQYNIDRFERQMRLVDDGKIPRALAIAALHEEFNERYATQEEQAHGEEITDRNTQVATS